MTPKPLKIIKKVKKATIQNECLSASRIETCPGCLRFSRGQEPQFTQWLLCISQWMKGSQSKSAHSSSHNLSALQTVDEEKEKIFLRDHRNNKDQAQGYRESALIWALSSAGAAWGVATACAQGWIDDCSCVHDGQPGWEYGGCSYSVQHGITASRKLLTRSPIVRSPLRSVEKHNLKAGRLAVKKTLIASCKCHGVSGSCQQKTCWKKTATLDHIADYLVEKYARSKMLSPDHKAKNADLVFIEPSPDPCLQLTAGRVCAWRNETHTQGDCSRLCCGKGFKKNQLFKATRKLVTMLTAHAAPNPQNPQAVERLRDKLGLSLDSDLASTLVGGNDRKKVRIETRFNHLQNNEPAGKTMTENPKHARTQKSEKKRKCYYEETHEAATSEARKHGGRVAKPKKTGKKDKERSVRSREKKNRVSQLVGRDTPDKPAAAAGKVFWMVPYAICMLVVGFPLAYLEMAFGQYTSTGIYLVFDRMTPAFVGEY
ncbi:wnt family protein [Teladorsagia circumcincta]|uniref:Protein Wnt n=1 Tax=Teladorsagia circumcincta TaxID=45464 RepID=A0A2G9UR57_TELCI|nr:wnt family protein [Teladorsagia circumcincta]